MADQLRRRPYIESNTNSATITAGSQATEALKLTHKGGFPLWIRGFVLTYDGSAQAGVRVAIKDNANDVYIVTENTVISNVGYDRTTFAARMIRPVEPNVLVKSGNDWTLIVWTDVEIGAHDLCLSWDGVIEY